MMTLFAATVVVFMIATVIRENGHWQRMDDLQAQIYELKKAKQLPEAERMGL